MNERDGYSSREATVRRSRKLRDLALLLPICGAFAFLSPLLDLFASANDTLGHKVTYVFGCWVVLIVCAFLLSRALRKEIRKK